MSVTWYRRLMIGTCISTDSVGVMPAGFLLLETDTHIIRFSNGSAWVASTAEAQHPNLATHDALGLATDAELSTYAGADYLVGTAQAGLSAEIVVGTTPGGELGGTWASPIVDTTHSGSAHHAQAHGPAQHTEGTAWRDTYQDANGDDQEIVLGAAGTVKTSNGASAAPSYQAPTGGLTRVGGNTTEATTTSTTVVDLMSITVTAIVAAQPFQFQYNGRKTAGAADRVQVGLKLNTTVVTDPIIATVTNTGYNASTTNQAEDGMAIYHMPSRVTGYLRGGLLNVVNKASAGVAGPLANTIASASVDAALITADITTIVLLGRSADALNTLGVDEAHVYAYATS